MLRPFKNLNQQHFMITLTNLITNSDNQIRLHINLMLVTIELSTINIRDKDFTLSRHILTLLVVTINSHYLDQHCGSNLNHHP